MGIYVSPGTYTRERDISNIIPNIASTSAALVGASNRGTTSVKLITGSQQFISEYGEPVPGIPNMFFHYTALAFLEMGNTLYCRRVVLNALYGGVDIKASSVAGDNVAFVAGKTGIVFSGTADEVLFQVFAKDPGAWNDNLAVIINNINDENYNGDSNYPIDDEIDKYTFDILVYYKDADGVWNLMESWKVSRKTKVDGYGRQMYLEDKINGYSKYIVVANNTEFADTVVPKENPLTVDDNYLLYFDGGDNGSTPGSSQINLAWNDFSNPDEIDVRILLNGGYTDVSTHLKMKEIAESRKDCIAILDIPYDTLSAVDNMVFFRRMTQGINSSYVALYTPWVRTQDAFNDKLVVLPPSGFVGAQYAYNDYVTQPWYAPAGFNRGMLNVLELTNVFSQGDRDELYKYQINPLQTFRGRGHVIWGQKTQQVKDSALSRVNVRRLLIILEKAVSASLEFFGFEINNALTRFRLTAMITEYMDTLYSQGAFQTEAGDKGFYVLCNEVNNTPDIIDRNEMHVDIFVKPARAAEFIQLQVVVTSTGASFQELISQGVMF